MSAIMIRYPEDLPVSLHREEIMAAIRDHQVVVVAGATGSGKTTQLPKMCLELGRTGIAHTQPRRIAARAVAERIAEELGVELGDLVGYQVRFTDRVSAKTKVRVMTDGILLNSLQSDRNLSRYDTIIIDEAHERSLNIDFLLGYLKQLLPKRPDLKLVITSATIDPLSFSKHFDDAPIIEVSGRSFPIEVRYRPTFREVSDDSDPDEQTTAADYLDGVVKSLRELEAEPAGDVLVFLSGESEIRDTQDAIDGRIKAGELNRGTEVLPLYGRLSASEQHRVFEVSKKAGLRRRVILATNVAETSLTIPNIKYVIDAGTARISRYSPKAKVQRLPIEAISQASANQRAGRAGRTSPGVVIRLYSEEDYNSRPGFTDPEILRTNLASVILQAAHIGLGDLTKFPFLQPPDARGVKDGLGLLSELGALKPAGPSVGVQLTKLGRDLARLPIEPRFARMLIEAREHDMVREVMIIVAGLTIQDPRERPLEKRLQADQMHARFVDASSDFLGLVNLWNYLESRQDELSSSAFRRLCKAEYLNYLRIREWQDLMRQLRSMAKQLGLVPGAAKVNPEGIHKSLLAGLLSQIGIRQDPDLRQASSSSSPKLPKGKPVRKIAEYQGSSGKKFVIFPGSALAKKPPLALMSSELVETSRLFARMNAVIDPVWAEKLGGDNCKRSYSEPHWEKSQGAVVGFERVMLFGVAIIAGRKMQFARIDPKFCRELFIRHALVQGEWHSQQQFEAANRQLVEQLVAMAERARSPQQAPDDEDLYRFFNERIPPEVNSTRSFEGWWKRAKRETPDLLTMTRVSLLGVDEEGPVEHDLPSEWHYGGQQFRLRYRFEPGAIDDGVSVDVPLPLLAGLDASSFDWLVPGMRAELITELIRSLPKPIRRHVVPANDWAAKALAVLPDEPREPLLPALGKVLQQLSGVSVSAGDFDVIRLPTSLRMTYRVLDAHGKQLGLSNDLNELQAKFSAQSRVAVAKVAERVHSSIERDNLTEWDFESLPQALQTTHGGNLVRAFPALVCMPSKENQPPAIAVRVFSTEAEQAWHHPRGLAALLVRAIANPVKYVEQHLTQAEKLAVAALGYRGIAAYASDVLQAVADREIRRMQPSGLIYQRNQYQQVMEATQAASMELMFETAAVLVQIVEAQRLAQKSISEVSGLDFLPALAAEKQHIGELLQPNLVSTVGLDRLPRLLVYLRAIALRIAKLAENPNRDRLASYEYDQALQAFLNAGGRLPLPETAEPKLVAARWLLEELRVSLFAQTLGTTETVSVQRIKKLLA